MPFPNQISTPQQPHGGGGPPEDTDWPDPMKAGRSPTLVTNLSEQISPYYKDVEGGYEEVIREAQKAMTERTDWQEDQMKGHPKYRPLDLERPQAIFRGMGGLPESVLGLAFAPANESTEVARGAPFRRYRQAGRPSYQDDAIMMRIRDEFMPTDIPKIGYPSKLAGQGRFRNPLGSQPKGLMTWADMRKHQLDALTQSDNEQSVLEHELGHMSFAPRRGQPGWKGDYDIEEETRGPGISGYLKEKFRTKPRYYRSSEDRWRSPLHIPDPRSTPEYWGGSDNWRYVSTPSEIDTRLAQMKRAYSVAHPGEYIRTTEDAQNAWNWWREKQRRENPRTLEMGDWNEMLMDQFQRQPREMNKIIQRLREVVQNQSGGLEQALIG